MKLLKHSGWFSSLVLLAACTFQLVSPLSELPLETSSWEQLGNLMRQGFTPTIVFDANDKPFVPHSPSGNISVSACSSCHGS